MLGGACPTKPRGPFWWVRGEQGPGDRAKVLLAVHEWERVNWHSTQSCWHPRSSQSLGNYGLVASGSCPPLPVSACPAGAVPYNMDLCPTLSTWVLLQKLPPTQSLLPSPAILFLAPGVFHWARGSLAWTKALILTLGSVHGLVLGAHCADLPKRTEGSELLLWEPLDQHSEHKLWGPSFLAAWLLPCTPESGSAFWRSLSSFNLDAPDVNIWTESCLSWPPQHTPLGLPGL